MKALVAVLVVVGLFFVPTARPAAAAGSALLGVYYGNQGWAMTDVRNMEAWEAKRNAVLNMFTDWCSQTKEMNNLFTQQLPSIWNNHNVPMITWQPYLCTNTPNNIDSLAAGGTYDSYLNAWASRLKTFLAGPDGVYGSADDRRVFLRLGHEMNGNWYPWSAAPGFNLPSDYIAMWRHVRGIFSGQGLDSSHVQWVWAVNNTDSSSDTAEQDYPGDAYVDWIGVDGYNWGASQSWSSWQTPSQVFDTMIGRLHTLTAKPLAITEVASSSSTTSGTNIPLKAQWITDFFSYMQTVNVQMICGFNVDKESDWAVFGGKYGDSTYTAGHTTYNAYSTYKAAVGGSWLLPSDPTNPRLLTDSQFAGQV